MTSIHGLGLGNGFEVRHEGNVVATGLSYYGAQELAVELEGCESELDEAEERAAEAEALREERDADEELAIELAA